ncbi:MAG: hypothetical protein NWE96_12360 [Candidatus Bathyarchaeota archaeon]|nr:hypothetical protein [Candidatus Bathyarchaeota archaeon]
MMTPDWKYTETVQKRIRITRVNTKERHVDAVDLDGGMSLCMNASKEINLDKVKKAKIYQATIKVYKADITPELESQLLESAINDPTRLKAIQSLKASGFKPSKFDLISLTH